MGNLESQSRVVLDVIRDGPIAWQTPAEVADALGWGMQHTCDELALLNVAGWVDVWDRDEGPAVTLTALAAEFLGVRLIEFGLNGELRWIGQGDPDPPAPRVGRASQPRSERYTILDFLLDPTPPPDVATEIAESAALLASRSGGAAAHRPTLLVGVGLTPWPGPTAEAPPRCPACGSTPLPPHAYCIRCDRWGGDAQCEATSALSPPAPTPVRKPAWRPCAEVRDARLEADRQRRKQRRRAKLEARGRSRKAGAGGRLPRRPTH